MDAAAQWAAVREAPSNDSYIFATGENASRIPHPLPKEIIRFGWSLFCYLCFGSWDLNRMDAAAQWAAVRETLGAT